MWHSQKQRRLLVLISYRYHLNPDEHLLDNELT